MKPVSQHTVYLHLGSNIGNRKLHLEKAIECISESIGPIEQQSLIYETEAWGKTDQAAFLNQAIMVSTTMWPELLLQTTKSIEKAIGRAEKERWAPRKIDIDIIFYDDYQIELKNLIVPHPSMHIRNFVLIPLIDLKPDFIHPIFRQTLRELLGWCQDDLKVTEFKT